MLGLSWALLRSVLRMNQLVQKQLLKKPVFSGKHRYWDWGLENPKTIEYCWSNNLCKVSAAIPQYNSQTFSSELFRHNLFLGNLMKYHHVFILKRGIRKYFFGIAWKSGLFSFSFFSLGIITLPPAFLLLQQIIPKKNFISALSCQIYWNILR